MRERVAEANVINLDTANVAQRVISDKLFQGLFSSHMLVHTVLLKVKITATGGDVTPASLGDVTVKSSSEGNITTLPLRFLYTVFPHMGIPCRTEAIASGNIYYIPIPFALLKGIRPKDSYLVAEKCNDYFLELSGTAEAGLTYTLYDILPILIGERNNNIYLPSDGVVYYTTDDLPQNVWYDSKLFVQGASWVALCKSDYADWVSTDELHVLVDNEVALQVSDILHYNRIWAYHNQMRQAIAGLDAITDETILLPLSLDKKMAKISRSSQYRLRFRTATQDVTVMALFQKIGGMSEEKALSLAVRQGLDRVVNPDSDDVTLATVNSTGGLTPDIKPLARKVYVKAQDQYIRVANTI